MNSQSNKSSESHQQIMPKCHTLLYNFTLGQHSKVYFVYQLIASPIRSVFILRSPFIQSIFALSHAVVLYSLHQNLVRQLITTGAWPKSNQAIDGQVSFQPSSIMDAFVRGHPEKATHTQTHTTACRQVRSGCWVCVTCLIHIIDVLLFHNFATIFNWKLSVRISKP